MLESKSSGQLIDQLWTKLVDRAEVPPDEHDFFEAQGVTKTQFDDLRKFPRQYNRQQVIITAAEISTGGYTTDITRDGCGLICCQQLFPQDAIRVLMPTGERTAMTVRWCRRLSDRCYAVGCHRVED